MIEGFDTFLLVTHGIVSRTPSGTSPDSSLIWAPHDSAMEIFDALVWTSSTLFPHVQKLIFALTRLEPLRCSSSCIVSMESIIASLMLLEKAMKVAAIRLLANFWRSYSSRFLYKSSYTPWCCAWDGVKQLGEWFEWSRGQIYIHDRVE